MIESTSGVGRDPLPRPAEAHQLGQPSAMVVDKIHSGVVAQYVTRGVPVS
ncbi:hypothetical protein AB0L44_21975 [Nonomuraea wenchangensis]